MCLVDGFHHVYGKIFQGRMASTYSRVRHEREETTQAEQLRVAANMTATQVSQLFPRGCPGNPYSVDPRIEAMETNRPNGIHVAVKIGPELYGVNLYEVDFARTMQSL